MYLGSTSGWERSQPRNAVMSDGKREKEPLSEHMDTA